jgi:hypothetical protein
MHTTGAVYRVLNYIWVTCTQLCFWITSSAWSLQLSSSTTYNSLWIFYNSSRMFTSPKDFAVIQEIAEFQSHWWEHWWCLLPMSVITFSAIIKLSRAHGGTVHLLNALKGCFELLGHYTLGRTTSHRTGVKFNFKQCLRWWLSSNVSNV